MNHQDFELLYELYYHPLYLYALSLTKNEADAQDIVANAFVKALLSFKKGNFEAWIYTVLKNEFYQLYKKKKKYVQENDFNILLIEDGVNIMDELIKKENRDWLYQQIASLSPLEQQIILFKLQTSLKDKEIASLLNISIENVRVIYHRTKQKLIEEGKYE